MAVAKHDSKWRLLLAAAPVFVVVSFVWAALLGQRGAIESPVAGMMLAVAAVLGALVAAPRIGGAHESPVVSVAQARDAAEEGEMDEPVVLRGHAKPLPDAAPLVSPGGELCLWFAREASATGENASDRPFLLVDRSGACIVLPAGARVTRGMARAATGHGREGSRSDVPAPLARERLLRAGDRLEVCGRLTVTPLRRTNTHARAAIAPAGRSLPVIAGGGTAPSLAIVIEAEDGWRALYGALAFVDALVAIAAGSLVAWPLLLPF